MNNVTVQCISALFAARGYLDGYVDNNSDMATLENVNLLVNSYTRSNSWENLYRNLYDYSLPQMDEAASREAMLYGHSRYNTSSEICGDMDRIFKEYVDYVKDNNDVNKMLDEFDASVNQGSNKHDDDSEWENLDGSRAFIASSDGSLTSVNQEENALLDKLWVWGASWIANVGGIAVNIYSKVFCIDMV